MKKKRMSAKLKHHLTFYLSGETEDGNGGFSESLGQFYKCRGAIWPVSSTETVKNKREGVEITHKIRIRYYPGILETMVIMTGQRGNERAFEIKSIINPDEANRFLDMVCIENV
jgi:SPP1 family predicted phage head-tail adaptor